MRSQHIRYFDIVLFSHLGVFGLTERDSGFEEAGLVRYFWTGERIDGRRWITRKADIDTIPVYVRGGTILPLAAAAECTDQLGTANFTLKVYPNALGQAVGEIVDRQRRLSFEARQKEDAIEVSVPQGPADPMVELPLGFPRSEVVIRH